MLYVFTIYFPIQSCVSVVLHFVSPESVKEYIRLMDEVQGLPDDHGAKLYKLEVIKSLAVIYDCRLVSDWAFRFMMLIQVEWECLILVGNAGEKDGLE